MRNIHVAIITGLTTFLVLFAGMGGPEVASAQTQWRGVMTRVNRWVSCAALGLAVALGPVAAAGQELPPDIQVDLYLVRADRHVQNEDWSAAMEALDIVFRLQADQGMETPAELWFTHARAALEAGYPHIAITSATRYLQEAGREGQDYGSALALLDEARGRAEGEATPTPAPTPTPTPASTPTALSGGEVEGLQPSEPGMGGPEVASAQTPVSPGQRVRLTMAHGGVVIGTVAAIGGTQSLTVNAEGGSPVEVNLEEVDMLEVSRGRQSTVKKGILGGGTAGLLGGLLNEINRAGEEVTSRATDKILAGATTIDEEEPLSWGRIALSGAGGALIGGVLGYFLLDEDWNAIPGFGETGTTNLVVELYRGSAGFSVGLRLPFGT